MKRSLGFLFAATLFFGQAPILAADSGSGDGRSPIFVSMLPHFTVNLGDGTFLQMEAQTMVRDDNTKLSMEHYMPAVRHNIIMYLSETYPDDIRTARQREEMREDIASIIRTTLNEKDVDDDVKGFFITSMIMQ